MSISTSRKKSDALWFLTPSERVSLVLEYQKQRKTKGKDYDSEIELVQLNMPKEQKNKYAQKAFLVIFTNRALFEFHLIIKNSFYQAYADFLQSVLTLIINPTKKDKSLKFCEEQLVEIYQTILACEAVAKDISDESGVKNVIYSCYEDYFNNTKQKMNVILNSIAKNRVYRPDPEAKETIIRLIYRAVNRKLYGGL